MSPSWRSAQHIRAGDRPEALQPGTAAPLPAGADAVIMQEDCMRLDETDGERVRLNRRVAAGEPEAALFPDQSSDILSSAVWADGLAEIPAGAALAKGDRVSYLPFTGLLDRGRF